MNQKTKGYVVVASRNPNFYTSAVYLAETILDHYPDAKITLFTQPEYIRECDRDIFDNIFECPDHYRAKLYGMANSPYDLTFYIDADCYCDHEDIQDVFNRIKTHDMVFTPLSKENEYIFKSRYFKPDNPDEYYSMKLNGGVCLYDMTKPIVREFMQDWWDLYQKQAEDQWWPWINEDGTFDYTNADRYNKGWDQFTLWYLTNMSDKYKNIDIGIFDDWARWNWYNEYLRHITHIDKPQIIMHMSGQMKKWSGSYKDEGLAEL